MTDSEVQIIISAKNMAGRAFSDAQKQVKKFGGSAKKYLNEATHASQQFATAVAVLGGAAAYGLNSIATLASDAEESINAVNVVFGEGADVIKDFSKSAAKEIGLSASAFRQLSTETGTLLSKIDQPMKETAKQTVELTKRASDLASIYNTDVSLALSAMNQALRGETEAIRKYGSDVTDASLQEYLHSQGIQTKVQSLGQAAKVELRMQKIMADTAVAQGDFMNTSDGVANKTRIMTAMMDDYGAKIGESILPMKLALVSAGVELINALNGEGSQFAWLNGLVDTLKNGFQFLVENSDLVVGAIVGALVPAFVGLALAIGSAMLPLVPFMAAGALIVANWEPVKGFLEGLGFNFDSFGGFVGSVEKKVLDLINAFTGGGFESIGEVMNALMEKVEEVVVFISPLISSIEDIIVATFTLIKTAYQTYLYPTFVEIMETVKLIWDVFRDNFGNILDFISPLMSSLGLIIDGAMRVIYNTIQLICNLIQGEWDGAWTNIKNIIFGVFELITGIVGTAMAAIATIARVQMGIVQGIIELGWNMIKGIFSGALSALLNLWNSFWDSLSSLFSSGVDNLSAGWESFGSGLSSTMTRVWSNIKSTIADGINWVIRKVNGLITSMNSIPGMSLPTIPEVAFANGGVVSGSTAFADGGIVKGPQLFGFDKQVGLRGEAGAEAIVPLPDGRSIPVTLSEERRGNGGGVHINLGGIHISGNVMAERDWMDKLSTQIVKTVNSQYGTFA